MNKIKNLIVSLLFSLTVWMGVTPTIASDIVSDQKYTMDTSLPPLPNEALGNVTKLPKVFPSSWIYIDEVNFFNMFSGKVILLDAIEKKPANRIKGILDKNLIGSFVSAKNRKEVYIAEAFHERGARGKLTNILAIYDKQSLNLIKELVLPTKILTALPERYNMTLSLDEKFLFIANFTPAASFTVVNLDTKEVVGVIETPGCVLTYPTGIRNIASICSNGALLNTVINDKGLMVSQKRLKPFFDTDQTPVFEHIALINSVAYFPSFNGLIHMYDFAKNEPTYLGKWDLIPEKEKDKKWAPSGLGIIDQDEQGNFYIIMHENSAEGTQNHGGSQIWVFNAKTKKRINVIQTPDWAISLGVTRGPKPLLIVTNGKLSLDIFDPEAGKLIQTITDFGNVTPLFFHKAY
ncbi:MAG: amine dehydrogenase large subunit [Methylacidiphilales bacterium]|nr:amine dehydrogenase large subunit [Candidatus Methylacidiphilales bacterium]